MPDDNHTSRMRLDVDPREHDPEAIAPPPDELFGVLSDRTRRRILWFLLEESRTTVDELADLLLGWEISGDGVAGPEERDGVLVSLHHVHLPRLADAGLVRYDADSGAGASEIRIAQLSDAVRDLVRFGYRYERATGAEASG